MANDGYQGAVDAFNNLRLANGEVARPYTANWQGIIDAISDLQSEWGQADIGEYPPGWGVETDSNGNVISSGWLYPPKNGDLWYDSRQGRLMVFIDDGYYQTNGADVLTQVSTTPPADSVEGALWFDPDQDTFYVFDGTGWNIVSSNTTNLNTTSLLLDSTTQTQIGSTTYGNITEFTAASPADYNQKRFNQWLLTALGEVDTEITTLENQPDIAVGTSAPATPQTGDLWFDTGSNLLKVYSSNVWIACLDLTSTTSSISTVQSNLDSYEATTDPRLSSLESSVAAIPTTLSSYATTAALTSTQNTLQGNIDALTTTVGDLSRFSTVTDTESADNALDARITTLENTNIDLTPYATTVALDAAIANLDSTITARNYATETYVDTQVASIVVPDISGKVDTTTYDTFTATLPGTYLAKTGGTLTGTLVIDRNDISLPSIDLSTTTADSQKALKLKANSTGNNYSTFGSTTNYWEYAWNFGSNEDFCWVHDTNGKIFSVTGTAAYAKDLILGDFQTNTTSGVNVINQINLRTKLASIDTQISSIQQDIIDLETGVNNLTLNQVYYGDIAPSDADVNDGDIWFDSLGLRFTIRHDGAWIFPDRVEDGALKTAMRNAVDTSTDYASLKTNLLAALV